MRKYQTIDDAQVLATDILSKSIAPNVGCVLIAAIATMLGYPESLEGFVALAHEQEQRGGLAAAACIDDIFLASQQLLTISIVNR